MTACFWCEKLTVKIIDYMSIYGKCLNQEFENLTKSSDSEIFLLNIVITF